MTKLPQNINQYFTNVNHSQNINNGKKTNSKNMSSIVFQIGSRGNEI